MELKDLKNGMSFYLRNSLNKYFIINDDVYKEKNLNEPPDDFSSNRCLIFINTYRRFFSSYCKDLKKMYEQTSNDIIKVFDVDNNLIWEEIQWDKIKRDTKVLVKNNPSGKWIKAHFIRYDKYFSETPFIVYKDGKTSWTSENQDMVGYKYCKLLD